VEQPSAASASATTTTALANRAAPDPLPSGWEMRMTSTQCIYFVDLNMCATTWDDSRLSSTVDADALQSKRDYRRKVVYFWSQPSMRPIADARCDVRVHRGRVFKDNLAAIMSLRSEDLCKRLVVKFEGEDALDYGGLSHEMFNPSYSLFEYQINPASGVNPEHLQVHRPRPRPRSIPPFFPRCRLCARFLNKVNLKDLEAVGYERYKGLGCCTCSSLCSCSWLMSLFVRGDETFDVMEGRFGEHVVVDLRPGGATRDVMEAKKVEYIDLVVVHRIAGRIAEHAFMEDLGDVLPLDLLRAFDEHNWNCSSAACRRSTWTTGRSSPTTAGTRRRTG
jgi:E3 ubiquitin-protein ligase NEDD4